MLQTVNDRLDWHNPEGHEYPFDLSKSLPLIEDQGRQVVPANYFFNNDLEYLKGGSFSGKYITSTTKTKAAKYNNIEGIKDMVLTLWSPVKVAYDKHVVWVTSLWVKVAYACHWKSTHDVYSKKRIIAVMVRIMQISQENGQNRTNTDTGTDKECSRAGSLLSKFPNNHPPQETNKETLQAREDLMKAIQAFLKEYDHILPNEKCMALLLAEERFLKIKQTMEEEQNQPEVIQDLLLKLLNDLQILKGIQQEKKETAAQSFTPYWNFSMIDDEKAKDNFLKDVCTFLRKFSRIPFGVTPKVILIAWERFGKIKDALTDKHYHQEDIQELMSKLL
ncbi:hypothetical protein Tco_0883627 [Tanacetum coccineum]